MKVKRLICFLLLISFILTMFACAGPRLIINSTGKQGVVKFVWDDDDEQGLVKCDVAQNGALSNCRNIKVELKE